MPESNSKMKLVLVFIACCLLCLLYYTKHVNNEPKTYAQGNFYESNNSLDVNSQALYEQMVGNSVLEENACSKTMTSASNPLRCNKFTWIVDGQTKTREELVKADDQDYYLLYEDGDYIVAPVQLTFINSNIKTYIDGEISIRAYAGTKYIIHWDDVDAWWCHMDKTKNQHTTKIGAGGKFPVCVEGMIIGKAKSTTRVTIYKVNDAGVAEVCDLAEFFYE